MVRALSIALFVLAVGCSSRSSGESAPAPSPVAAAEEIPVDAAPAPDAGDPSHLEGRFAPPAGFQRVEVAGGSFAAYLRRLPLRTDRTHVRSYAGRRLASPSAAVATLDVGDRDLQQCADSIVRLHAEWLWSQDRADEVGYHFVSGDLSTWKDWRKGWRFRVRGSDVTRVKRGKPDGSYESFRRYLTNIFMYAGTASMHRDSEPAAIGEARAGDFFVQPGSPGHAVLILDIAESADGRKAALIGQGFMPAQEFHVLESGGDDVLDGVWFVLPETGDGIVDTPSWKPFRAGELRRFTRLR